MLGFDCGTYNLITAKRHDKDIKHKKTVNAYVELPMENKYMFNMFKKNNVKIIEMNNMAYIVGSPAIDLCYTIPQIPLKRPMRDGCLNPTERDAFTILSVMIHSLIGEVEKDKEVLYYSVPANATNNQTDADFHQNVLQSIFNAYKVNNKTVQAFPLNEALAVIFSELNDKLQTGIGISFGSGMVNLCYAIFGQPVFQMSLVNSGDWIDAMAAKACGESPVVINQEKTKIDLTKQPTTLIERAIKAQYEILINKVVFEIKKALANAGAKAVPNQPIDVVLAGGACSPKGFDTLFSDAILAANWSIPVANVRRAEDNLYSVAKGLLVAAENHQ